MIEARGLQKWFGSVHAVRGVSFGMSKGEVVGLLGHNGAGKSTTIRMLTGCAAPDAGSVSIAGVDVAEERVRATAQLGYLPESTPLYPEMPARDYLVFRATLSGVPRRERAGRVDHVIERCWLKDVARRRIAGLSKGYKQRVGLAAALVHDPQVLVLDEPTSGLDPAQVRETRELIRGLSQQRTVLISSHVLPEVEQLCSRVIIFAAGEVRADASLDHLLRSGSRTFLVEARDAGDETLKLLLDRWRAIPGLEQVRGDGLTRDAQPTRGGHGWRTWLLDFAPLDAKLPANAPADPREAIALGALASGIVIRELRSQSRTLEQLFLNVLERADSPAPSLAPSGPPATP
jgi:ABC-2 type transport system ATP-binding protein